LTCNFKPAGTGNLGENDVENATFSYGETIPYQDQKPIPFPDFSLTYRGARHQTIAVYPRGFTYDDFDLQKGNHHQVISWTPGTGDIGPVQFEVEGQRYLLEIGVSEILGRLNNGKLVVWREDDFLRRRQENHRLNN
jgi:hypothetical protein